MALARVNLVVQDQSGNKVDGAQILVQRESDLGLPSVYSDRAGTASLGNPFTASDGADAGFHVAGGAYKITATIGAFSRVWPYVAVGTLQEHDYELAADEVTYDDGDSPPVYSNVKTALDALFDGAGAGSGANVYVPAALTRAAIQAAVDLAAAAGGGIVQLLDGDYASDGTSVLVTTDDIWINGSANTRFLATNNSTVIDGLIKVSHASGMGTDTTLGANAAIGDLTLTVTSAANIAQGDYIQIAVTQAATGQAQFMMTRVLSKASNVLTLQDPMPFVMLTGDTSTSIRTIPVVKNNRVNNIRFVGNGNSGAGTHGLTVYQAVEYNVDGCSFDGFHTGSGLLANRGYMGSIDNLYAIDCGNGSFADLYSARQTRMHAGSLRSEDASGFGPQLELAAYCSVESVLCVHAGHGVSGRGSKYACIVFCTIGSIIVENSASTGVGISGASCDNIFGSIISISNRAGSGGDVGLWFSDQHNKRNVIHSAFCKNNINADIFLGTTDTDNRILVAIYDTKTDNGARNYVGSSNNPGFVTAVALGINANAVGDTAIAVQSPTPRYRISSVIIQNVGTTASLTTAQWGLFSATGGGGTALAAAGQSMAAITSNAINTNANNINTALATSPNATWDLATLYFRITQAQGAAATINVFIILAPLPQ